jgi:hypothetical protein
MKRSKHTAKEAERIRREIDSSTSSKPPLPSSRFAKPLPADHWIYKQGPQFGFVSALPESIKRLQTKASEAPTPPPADSSKI